MRTTVYAVMLVLAAACATLAAAQSGEETLRSVFTLRQATAGKSAYAKHCATCHQADLSGDNEIPQLAGKAFMAMWGSRSSKDLRDYMSAAMPYGRQSLSAEDYTSILAFILQSNRAAPGERELTASTAIEIRSLTPAP